MLLVPIEVFPISCAQERATWRGTCKLFVNLSLNTNRSILISMSWYLSSCIWHSQLVSESIQVDSSHFNFQHSEHNISQSRQRNKPKSSCMGSRLVKSFIE